MVNLVFTVRSTLATILSRNFFIGNRYISSVMGWIVRQSICECRQVMQGTGESTVVRTTPVENGSTLFRIIGISVNTFRAIRNITANAGTNAGTNAMKIAVNKVGMMALVEIIGMSMAVTMAIMAKIDKGTSALVEFQ